MHDAGMVEWAREHLYNVVLSAGHDGSEMRADCPFCAERRGSADSGQHLYINKQKSVAHCFRCDYGADWIRLVMDVEHCSYTTALMSVGRQRSAADFEEAVEQFTATSEIPTIEQIKETAHLPEDFVALEDATGILRKQAIAHLKKRGIPKHLAFSGMFGVVPGQSRLYILASDGYYQARALLPSTSPKYMNPETPKHGVLGLWDSPYVSQWIQSLDDPVHVCEGIFSALVPVDAGFAAMALLGKRAMPEQVSRLAQEDRDMVIMLDADATQQAWSLADNLIRLGKQNIQVAVLEYGDPEDGMAHDLYSGDWRGQILYRVRDVIS